ncbi:Protein-export membrane protein SecD [uncultured archaeon]|nr:Protein-export membrane protein SecD [uncultured archaeon]
MTDEEPFYKNIRVVILTLVILGSIASIAVYHLNYGIDLEGGSWLQVQLQGAVAQVDANEVKLIQVEFGKLLNDPNIKVDSVYAGSVTFITSKETTKNTIDSFGLGISNLTSAPGGGTIVTLQTTKDALLQQYLKDSLNAEVQEIPSSTTTSMFEIRKAVTEDDLNALLSNVSGKVITFKQGVTPDTRDETIKRLSDKLNPISLKTITITPIGANYLLIDLPGVSIQEARNLALTPGKFEIRIQVNGNVTEHVLYGDQIVTVQPLEQLNGNWGVPFILSDAGAASLRDAAIKYGAVTNPSAHYLSMYLDNNLVFSAPLAPDLARNMQSVPQKNMIATTGAGDTGHEKALELQLHLRAGALPVSVTDAGSGTVPAPLGQRFKEQVAIAGIIALLLVAFVVALRYKQPNIIVPMLATSFSEVIMILGFASLPFIGLQLDLATIAGIIAVIGTGVDHLIIITDEVLAGGVMPPGKVYLSRIAKAFAIIIAAAATVIVAMLPLILAMDSSALKGFAEITIIGVFIGVFIARPAYAVIIQGILVPETGEKFEDED